MFDASVRIGGSAEALPHTISPDGSACKQASTNDPNERKVVECSIPVVGIPLQHAGIFMKDEPA